MRLELSVLHGGISIAEFLNCIVDHYIVDHCRLSPLHPPHLTQGNCRRSDHSRLALVIFR